MCVTKQYACQKIMHCAKRMLPTIRQYFMLARNIFSTQQVFRKTCIVDIQIGLPTSYIKHRIKEVILNFSKVRKTQEYQ